MRRESRARERTSLNPCPSLAVMSLGPEDRRAARSPPTPTFALARQDLRLWTKIFDMDSFY